MRKLNTSDVFTFARCLKAIGIKDELKNIAQNSDNIGDAWSKGFDLIYNLLDLATEKNGEKHIYEFLASPFEMKPKDVEEMPLPEFFENCKKLSEENDLKGFFKSAGKLMK